jgi:enhancer of mRNA-decapping protein 4
MRPAGTAPSNNHRLIWCPYIPDDDPSTTDGDSGEDSVIDDPSRLLVLTHNGIIEIWNVDSVSRENGAGPLEPSEVQVGFLTIDEHTQTVVDASYSPDGTALAVASLDGEVKFFQIYLLDKSPPKCVIIHS